ncbi:MAG: carboxypeptidase-like regulatory domain-containing protein [Bacteroidetes bacterium]|nr:carboxypeptidase-like regulatory domain-containing protein [Bacteroidota bacterium]
MKSFLVLIGVFLFSVTTYSQSFYKVSGKIFDANTLQPLQGASVFAQNTTIGTASDAQGNFTLYLPNGGYDLVITFTGYKTDTKRVTTGDEINKNIEIHLSQKEKEMADVTIVANSEVKDGWEKYGNFFLEEFIGKSSNSKNCTIKNPEALKFYFSKRKNRLKVLASEPLQIENKSLGYDITYTLDSFTHEYNSEISLYTGYPLFSEIPTTDSLQKEQWARARTKAYLGSTLHFMRSIYQQSLKEEGFEIQFLVKTNDKQMAIPLKNEYAALHYQKDDSTHTVEILPNQLDVGVIYTKEKPSENYLKLNTGEPSDFQFSVLSFLPQQSIIIEQNGYYYEQNELSISGYWAWSKIADMVPYDYIPSK